ncbi:MAG: PA14 domain-containing protein [bacterium]|nr:PA14 domain-containing protein [bacterium]
MKRKIGLAFLAFLLVAGTLLATGCGSEDQALDSLRQDVVQLQKQLLEEKQAKQATEKQLAEEERMAEVATAVVEKEIADLEARLAEKEREDRLAELERAVSELQQPPMIVYPVIVPVPATVTPSFEAFEAKVYKGSNFDKYVGVLVNPYPISFNWQEGGPLNLTNDFSVRWQGTVYFEAGTYHFFVRANEGVRLYVDGRLLLDKWGPHGTTEYGVTTPLSAGSHQIRVDYREIKGPAEIFFSWTKIQ